MHKKWFFLICVTIVMILALTACQEADPVVISMVQTVEVKERVLETSVVTIEVTRAVPCAVSDTPNVTPVPEAISYRGVVTQNANVRFGPGGNYPVIAGCQQNQELVILGRNVNGTWFYVRLENGQTGWIFRPLVQIDFQVADLLMVNAPPAPTRLAAAPTATQEDSPNVANILPATSTPAGEITPSPTAAATEPPYPVPPTGTPEASPTFTPPPYPEPPTATPVMLLTPTPHAYP